MTAPSAPVVTYWAISFANSKTFQANSLFVLAALAPILALPDVVALVPPRFMLIFVAVVAVVNMYLRTQTVRPVALIPPGETKAVAVLKLSPPAPPVVTD